MVSYPSKMNKISKIFVGGTAMSGKNILWCLLDGYPALITNCTHSNIGFFVLTDNCKNYFLRDIPEMARRTQQKQTKGNTHIHPESVRKHTKRLRSGRRVGRKPARPDVPRPVFLVGCWPKGTAIIAIAAA